MPITHAYVSTIQNDEAEAAGKISGNRWNAEHDIDLTSSDVGLGNVTNDVQTKAAIVPNTAPSAGQLLVGNAGGTAYAPVSSSGDVTVASTGAFTIGAGKVTEAMQVLADNTTNNASTSKHGYLKKLSNVSTEFMNGQGDWATPAGGATPGGADTQVQFNDGGSSLGGDSGLTFDKTNNKLTITAAAHAGAAALSIRPDSGASLIDLNNNGTVVIDGDSGTGSVPLTIKSGGSTKFTVNFQGEAGVSKVNIASGVTTLHSPGSNRSLLSSYVDLELSPGALGGGGTKVQINNGTLGTLRDVECRTVINGPVTVASLPTAAAGYTGARAFVTDATATTFASTVSGGGSNKVPVYCDGASWLIG